MFQDFINFATLEGREFSRYIFILIYASSVKLSLIEYTLIKDSVLPTVLFVINLDYLKITAVACYSFKRCKPNNINGG